MADKLKKAYVRTVPTYAFWCCYLLLLATPALAGPTHHLTVLHFNDFHGYFDQDPESGLGGAERMAGVIRQIRRENDAKGADTIVLQGGDLISGTALSSHYKGALEFAFMDRLDTAAMVVGNHEFDFTLPVLSAHIADSKTPVLAANIFHRNSEPVPWRAHVLYTTAHGIRLGIFGITTTTTPVVTMPANVRTLRFADHVRTAKTQMAELEPATDYQIALTHVGVEADKQIAAQVAGIDLVIGGHDHVDPTRYCRTTNEILVCQTPAKGKYVGRVDLALRDGEILNQKFDLIPLDAQSPADAATNAWLAPKRREVGKAMHRVVANSPRAIGYEPLDVHPGAVAIGQLAAAVMRDSAGAQIAFTNRGGVRAPLRRGPITQGDLRNVHPFENRIMTTTMRGHDLLRVVATGLQRLHAHEGQPALQWAGLRFKMDARGKITDPQVETADGWLPLATGSSYRIATVDFLTQGGDGYQILTRWDWQPHTEDLTAALINRTAKVLPHAIP